LAGRFVGVEGVGDEGAAGRSGGVVSCAVGGAAGGGDNVLAKYEAGVGEHDETEVEAERPQGNDEADAVQAFVGQDGGAEGAIGAGGSTGRRTNSCHVLARWDGGADGVNLRLIEHCHRSVVGGGKFACVVLCEYEEPGHSEGGGVDSIYK